MKKLITLLLIFTVTVGGSWGIEDRQVSRVIRLIADIKNTNISKEKISLPAPYPNYTKLLIFAEKLGFDHYNFRYSAGETFFENILKDVSGDLGFSLLQINTSYWNYQELYTATIYVYVMHRYMHDFALRKSIYQKILGDEMGTIFFENEEEFNNILGILADK